MNIAFFTNNYLPYQGGVAISIKTFKDELEKLGHNVFVFAPKYPEYKDREKNVFRMPSFKVHSNGFYLPLPFTHFVRQKFKALHIDIIHAHHFYMLGETAMRLAKENNIPLVFTHHTQYEKYLHYIPFDRGVTEPIVKNLVMSFCNQCDMVLAPSNFIKNSLVVKGINTKIQVLTTGVDTSKCIAMNVRNKLGISPGMKIILYAGRIAREKNLEFLVRSMINIIGKKPDTRGIIAGKESDDGNTKARLERMIKEAGMQQKIIFTGQLDCEELKAYYREADIFLFTSRSETQGLVILEAMAQGTPVIAVDDPSLREFVLNGKNGYLVPEDGSFSQRAIDVLKDESKMKRLSIGAKETARNFSKRKLATRLVILYKEVLAQNGQKTNSNIYKPFTASWLRW